MHEIQQKNKFFEGGKFDKFIVIKNEDVSTYLTLGEAKSLGFCLDNITDGRVLDGKRAINRYLVINVDEPYAPEIVEILKRNGHWG